MASIRTILWAVNVLLVAAVAYAASVLAAGILERTLVENTSAPAKRTASRPGSETQVKPQPLSDFQVILATNMFRARRTVQAPKAKLVPASITATPQGPSTPSDKLPFKLILTGTFIIDRASVAFVVGPDGRTERVYGLKECLPRDDDNPIFQCLPNQGTLVKIGGDHIVVGLNGGRYVIKMGEETPKDSSTPVAKPSQRGKGRAHRVKSSVAKSGAKQPAFPASREGDNIDMKVPNAEVEKAFENFAGIVNQARVVPYLVDGNAQGFQIRKIVPGSIFERLGLQNSDVIKSVNGESLTTADQALRLFSLFRNEREVFLEVQRNKEDLTLSYTIE
jgi:type II secretion system protein C